LSTDACQSDTRPSLDPSSGSLETRVSTGGAATVAVDSPWGSRSTGDRDTATALGFPDAAHSPNVRIHATSAAVELGDPNDALVHGETVEIDALAPGLLGRRSQVHIDLAWAYGQQRNDPATVLSLLEAERIAPEAIRFNVVARELLRECLKRERRTATPGLRGLAARVGILN
jgi:hypothetical protein